MVLVVVAVARCCLLLVVVRCCWVFGVCRVLLLFVDVGCWCCSLLIDGCRSLLFFACCCCVLVGPCNVLLFACFVVDCFVSFLFGCRRVWLVVVVLCV